MLDIGGKPAIITHVVVTTIYQMQRYRRGHNEHDWKSCDGQKPSEGSNPSRCARSRNRKVPGFFYFTQEVLCSYSVQNNQFVAKIFL